MMTTEPPLGKTTILSHVHIIEDDSEISSLLSTYLTARGFDCTVSGSVEQAQKRPPDTFDIFIVDVMLPGDDGLSFCRWLRERSELPVIILSAVKGDTERIIGIELGADDYLEKPFNPRELLARMNALLRRAKGDAVSAPAAGQICFSGWALDFDRQKLHSPDALLVPLSSTEYQLMTAMISAAPAPVTREDIARHVLGVEIGPEDRRVDILISRLRKKLMAVDSTADFIRTVRNKGYLFCAEINGKS
ncbi:response regulator [Parasedimentitalea maritima]|uniref:Response regulator n=1 Tax=Parasedimentitalea maritima TaxID=2578117 RepID=A0A6A4R990_9RHOB|nr:response regulator [Zongyanglinia marina]